MSDKKCPECAPPGAPGWMVTYGDLMTLLLCFFVLLFSFSTMDQKKFESLKESMRGAFGVVSGTSTTMGTGSAKKPQVLTDNSLDQAVNQIRQIVQRLQTPQEKLDFLSFARLRAREALRLVSAEKQQVEKIVHELEKPQARDSGKPDNPSEEKHDQEDVQEPKVKPQKMPYSAATSGVKEHSEMVLNTIEPEVASGDKMTEEMQSDMTKANISPGREHHLFQNTGKQNFLERSTGKMRPKDNKMDEAKRRSEDKDFLSEKKTDDVEKLKEFALLSGLVDDNSEMVSHAVFHFPEDMLFEKDSVILKEEAKENIFMLVKNNYSPEHELFFQIEGHVDKLHNTAPGYDNSWSFAAARAENVLNFLLGESDLLHKDFKKAHFSVVSFGEYQPKYRYEENQEKSSNGRIEVRMFRSP